MTKAFKRDEHQEQANTCEWFHLQYPQYRGHLFAIPNGGQRHPAVAAKLKAEGVVPGVFDLFLMVARPGYSGMWIEMKAVGGKVSAQQATFKQRAEAQGFRASVCYGFDQARAAIAEYLG